MDQINLFQANTILTVSQLNRVLHQILESEPILQNLWVSGEISNFSRPSSGHIYFTLKDSQASIRCVMWKTSAARLNFAPREGLAVEAHGYINIYEVSGQLQLYVDTLRPAGEGALYQEFMRLKAKLEADGLFDEERKRAIPRLPRLVGVVTSPTGAAFQDLLNTLRARCPMVEVVLAPVAVQGDAAPAQIAAALAALNLLVQPDVIIVGRGGGSLEDLWAFNDERVVRAVAASQAPVISGVGHETDFTLTDFAADLRAPTPTGAAVMAVPDRQDLQAELESLRLRLTQDVMDILDKNHYELRDFSHRLDQVSPRWQVLQDMQRLDELSLRITSTMKNILRTESARVLALNARLKTLDPRQVLNRGYALVRSVNGELVTSLQQVKLDSEVDVRLKDGSFGARVTKIDKKDKA